ncbi:MAG: PH domain-containing protein [Ruminococcaceae bacterium]|nr:PH domain-containing protein [Oscillospiraceae bacterium]
MTDFKNAIFLDLTLVHDSVFEDMVNPLLPEGETVLFAYHTLRNGVLFTDRRILFIGTAGWIEKRRDVTAISYRKVLAFSLETGKERHKDSAVEIAFKGLGKIRLEFAERGSVPALCKLLSQKTL